MPPDLADDRIVVVGGGIAGTTAALALAQAGCAVDLLDARKLEPDREPGGDGRTTAILDPGVGFLRKLGVWPWLAADAAPLARLRIVSLGPEDRPDADIVFAARELGLPAFGYNVENHSLLVALRDALRRHSRAALHLGARVAEVEFGSRFAKVVCTDGRTFTGALIVAADGRESVVREQAGIAVERQATGQTAIVTRFAHSRPHHSTSIELHRRGGPFTLVPLKGRRSSLVWVERTPAARKLLDLDAGQFRDALADRVRSWLGEPAEVAPAACFPILNVRARRLVASRLVLVGEAAHTLSPLGAQGFNMSLRDAETLFDLAVEARASGRSLAEPDLLARYAQLRETDIHARMVAIAALGRVVDSDHALARAARSAGLRVLGASPMARRAVMRGLMAPVPPLP